jgi:hypothetical protein
MGRTKDPSYVPYLIKVYDDADPSIRQNAMEGLKLIGTKEANEFLNANAADKARIKNNLSGSQTTLINDDNEMAAFIKKLTLDRSGLNLLLERLNHSTLETQALLTEELKKLFGDSALEWWEAIAKDLEAILAESMTRLVIPAPPPGNLGSSLAVAGAIGLLTGNVNAGALAASSGNLLLNEKLKFPSVCNLCGIEEGKYYKVITKDIVFSELGAALGGPLMGQKKVELQVPVCGKCANLSMAPGVYLENYIKVEKEWFITLSIANSTVAEEWMKMNQGRVVANPEAQVSDRTIPQSPVSQMEAVAPQANKIGTIEIFRKAKMTGFMHKVSIILDDKQMGTLKGNEALKFNVLSGAHILHVKGGGLSNRLNITVLENQQLRFQTEFSDAGMLGGGLKLEKV